MARTRYTYDAAGNPTGLQLADGSHWQATYDGLNRLLNKTTLDPRGQTQSSFAYTYDAKGDVMSETDGPTRPGGGRFGTNQLTYGYDALDRLISSSRDGVQTEYQYDSVGNRLDVSTLLGEHHDAGDRDSDAIGLQAKYDSANQLTSVVGPDGRPLVSYTYDNNGNLLSRSGPVGDPTTYTWDGANRLSAVTSGDDRSLQTTYRYDGDGNLLQQQTNLTPDDAAHHNQDESQLGNTVTYTLDQSGGLSQVLAATGGHQTASYVYGLDRLSATLSFSAPSGIPSWASAAMRNTVYYGTDVRGSVRTVTDSRGQLLASRAYDPFGTPMSRADDAQSFFAHLGEDGQPPVRGNVVGQFGFTGALQDPTTGLVNLRARFYQPSTGRFLNRDSVSGFLTNPLTENAYAYAAANPTSFVDPSGHFQQFIQDHIQGAQFYGQSPLEASTDFAQGLAAELEYDNNWWVPSAIRDMVAPQSGESPAKTLGRLAGDAVVLAQIGGEVITGGSMIGGSAVGCLTTAVGCVAVVPAVAEGGTLVAHGSTTGLVAAANWDSNYGVWQASTQSSSGNSRFDALATDPQTGRRTASSESEAQSILEAESQGIVSGARRPNLSAGEPNLDFVVNGGYADVKTPVDPTIRSLSDQAADIGGKINMYDSGVKPIIDLKNLDSTQKSAFKSALASVITNMGRVAFIND